MLYVTDGCHLCDEAAASLAQARIPFETVSAAGDAARFLRTPVLEVDGIERADANVAPGRFGRLAR